MGFTAGTGKELCLDGQSVQEVVHTLGGFVGIQTLAQCRVLGGDADRTAAGVAMVAIAGLSTNLVRIIRFLDVLVTVHRHHHRMAKRNGIGTKGNCLGNVGTISDSPA